MARIRTIKPEFWQDEKMAPMPALDRLVFLGLLSMADDAGRLVDNVKAIDGFLFSETDETARGSLERLAAAGRIVRYVSASGQRLVQLANWSKHQKVDNPAKYVLPAPTPDDLASVSAPAPSSSRESSESVAKVSRSDLGPTTKDQGPATEEAEPHAVADAPAGGDTAGDEKPDDDRRGWTVPGIRLTDAEALVVAHFRRLYPRRGPVDRKTHDKLRRALVAGYSPTRIIAALDGNHADAWCQETKNLGLAYVVRDFANLDKYADKAESPAPPPATGKPTAAVADEAEILFARLERAGLLAFSGSRERYTAAIHAAANGEGPAAFEALVKGVKAWELGQIDRRFVVGDLRKRLTAYRALERQTAAGSAA